MHPNGRTGVRLAHQCFRGKLNFNQFPTRTRNRVLGQGCEKDGVSQSTEGIGPRNSLGQHPIGLGPNGRNSLPSCFGRCVLNQRIQLGLVGRTKRDDYRVKNIGQRFWHRLLKGLEGTADVVRNQKQRLLCMCFGSGARGVYGQQKKAQHPRKAQ